MKSLPILAILLLLATGTPTGHTYYSDDTDEGDVIVGAVLLLVVETVAFLAACIGILSTSETGGRVLGAIIGVPVIVGAVAPVLVDWLHYPHLRWLYCFLVVPFSLGCAFLWCGFRTGKGQRPTRHMHWTPR
jgi:Kef-type K+ transport system membrane component KefB